MAMTKSAIVGRTLKRTWLKEIQYGRIKKYPLEDIVYGMGTTVGYF